MKMAHDPVSAWYAVDTPPTSHRSHVATRGRSPMAACSAACADPGSDAAVTRARAMISSGTAHHTARVTSTWAGRSSGTTSMTSPDRWSFRWYPTTWLVTRTSPKDIGVSASLDSPCVARTSMSVVSRDWVYQSAWEGRTRATW